MGLTPEQWQADLAFLAKELPAKHINAFATISRTDFDAQVHDLDSRIPKLNDAAVRAGILKIVASLGDAHTNANIWGPGGPYPIIPLGLYWFKDGVFVVTALEGNKNVLGTRLLRVGKLSVEDASRKLGDYVPHENEAQLKAQVPSLITHPDLLEAIGAVDNASKVSLEFQPATGDRIAVQIEGVIFRERPQWVWAYAGEQPLYRRQPNVPYTAAPLAGGSTVYFAYNRCVNDPRNPFPKFAAELKKVLEQPNVNRLIIDLRNNAGGNSAILDPFITWLKTSRLNRKGSLVVLIGRPTFSSAVLNAVKLKNETAAILAGEPTGGKPDHFGELRSLELPNSHIRVTYSTRFFNESKNDTPSLMPDIVIEPTSKDYLSGADPVLDHILRQPAPDK